MVCFGKIFGVIIEIYLMEWIVIIVEKFWFYNIFYIIWLDKVVFFIGFVLWNFFDFGIIDSFYKWVVVIEKISFVGNKFFDYCKMMMEGFVY